MESKGDYQQAHHRKTQTLKSNLPLVWTAHLREEEAKKRFKEAVISDLLSSTVIDRVRTLLVDKVGVVENEIALPEQFNKPAWAYWRAYADGKVTSYLEILKLIERPMTNGK